MVSNKRHRKLPATQDQPKPRAKPPAGGPAKFRMLMLARPRAVGALLGRKSRSKRALLVEHPSRRRQDNRLIADPKLTRRCQSSKLGAEDFLALPASHVVAALALTHRRGLPGGKGSLDHIVSCTMHAQVVR